MNVVTTANDIQMTYSDVVTDRQLLYSKDYVEVANAHVVINRAMTCINNAKPDSDPFANLVAKKQSIAGALQKRGEQSYERQR
jgi:hypothetical protein